MNRNTEIIIKIEDLLQELKQSLGVSSTPKKKSGAKGSSEPRDEKFSGLTAEIFNLVQEGYFKEPREISEIQKKLRLEGVNKPTTSLMKPLLLLVRKKIIGRNEPSSGKGPYKYYQRNK
jgi:hypothetical protein